MFTNILIVLPIFALILTGWIARKTGALGPNATREVNRLVVYLALPAVLFDIVANAKLADIWEPGFTLAFAGGCFIIFGATLWWRVSSGHALADAAIDGLNASYANTGFVGFPLVLSLVGDRGMAPTLVATLVTVCALFATAITLIEAGLQTETRRRDIARKTLFSLVKNPLLVAPVLGALVMLSGSHLPGPVHVFLKLLGGAASPCALIALGLFLAGTTSRTGSPVASTVGVFVLLKLIGQPLMTWLIAAFLLKLPPETTHIAVLLAALPTGTGSFMLAEFYDREAALTGRIVLVSTVLSIATISLHLAIAGT